MQAGTYIDPAAEYEAVAERCATKGYWMPMLVRALLQVPEHVMADIESDPPAFERRVKEYMHGLANT